MIGLYRLQTHDHGDISVVVTGNSPGSWKTGARRRRSGFPRATAYPVRAFMIMKTEDPEGGFGGQNFGAGGGRKVVTIMVQRQ